jgi:hypothetical protein
VIVEDFSVFLADFGVDVVIDGVTVRGIFDNPFVAAGGGIGMETTNPTLGLPTENVPSDPIGKTFARGSVTYEIVGHEPDGTGWSVLILERTS